MSGITIAPNGTSFFYSTIMIPIGRPAGRVPCYALFPNAHCMDIFIFILTVCISSGHNRIFWRGVAEVTSVSSLRLYAEALVLNARGIRTGRVDGSSFRS